MSDVFVSYSRKDEAFVVWLRDALEAQGRDVWRDKDDIPSAVEWRPEIRDAIDNADAFVFVVSPDSLDSGVCSEELTRAAELNKPIVPVLIREQDGRSFPDAIAPLNFVLCTGDDQRDAALVAIAEALDTDPGWRKAHKRLLVRALEWDSNEDPSLLLRGSDLTNAESALAVHGADPPLPTEAQRRYVLVSRQRATRRLRSVVAIAVVTALAIAALGVVAFVQYRTANKNAKTALSRQLAADSTAQLADDPQLALLLALEAHDTSPTIQAQEATRQAAIANSAHRDLPVSRTSRLSGLVFSPDGTRFAATDASGVQVWSLTRPHARPTMFSCLDGTNVETVAFSADGTHLAAGGVSVITGGVACVWNVENPNERVATFKLPVDGIKVAALAFSADGRRLAGGVIAGSGTSVGAVSTWDLDDPNAPATTRLLYGVRDNLAFDPGGTHVAAGNVNGVVRVWDLNTPLDAPPTVFEDTSGRALDHAAFSADGTRLSTSTVRLDALSSRSSVLSWDVSDPSASPAVFNLPPGWGSPVEFSPDGQRLAAAGSGGVRVWDLTHPDTAPATFTVGLRVTDLAFRPQSDQLATTSSEAGVAGVTMWDLAGPAPTPKVDPNVGWLVPESGVGREFTSTSSRDGTRLAQSQTDGSVKVWDAGHPDTGSTLLAHGSEVAGGAAFNPDASRLSIGWSDGLVQVYDLRHPGATPKEVRATSELPAPGRRPIWSTAAVSYFFSPDSTKVVAVPLPDSRAIDDGGVVRYDRQLIVLVVDLRSSHVTTMKVGHVGLASAVISPDGTLLAVSDDAGDVRVWNLDHATAPPAVVAAPFLAGRGAGSSPADFSPDGALLATAGADGIARIWDLANLSAPLATFAAVEGGAIWNISFSPDGTQVATRSADGSLRRWSCGLPCQAISKVLAVARSQVARQLTADERRRFLP